MVRKRHRPGAEMVLLARSGLARGARQRIVDSVSGVRYSGPVRAFAVSGPALGLPTFFHHQETLHWNAPLAAQVLC